MKKKSLIMLVCALMIISSVAFGTIAYLTDRAGVTNKFTIGNVDITVDETEVNPDGTPEYPEGTELNPDGTPVDPTIKPERTEEENEYPLIPGGEYVKDPTMTVKAGSQEAYVRMVVTINHADKIDAIFKELKAMYPTKYPGGFVPGDFVTGRNNSEWIYTGNMVKDDALNTYTMEFRYFEPVAPSETEDVTLPPLFETVIIPGELSNAHLSTLTDFTMDVNGHAIQITGFDTAEEAWAAFDAQTTAEAGVQQP